MIIEIDELGNEFSALLECLDSLAVDARCLEDGEDGEEIFCHSVVIAVSPS